MKKEYLAIGLMSGTSVDGIDTGLFRISMDGKRVGLDTIAARTYPFTGTLRQEILDVTAGCKDLLPRLTLLNMRLGEVYGDCVNRLLEETGTKAAEVSVIGSHGQTIHHIGQPEEYLGAPQAGTLQIGEGSVIARKTGIPTVSDFRPADMAAGGGGAPFVPLLDAILARGFEGSSAFQNIGGIGNVGFIPAEGDSGLIAFDTGPGNMILDILVEQHSSGEQHYDRGGLIGLRGRVNHKLLSCWMGHPYFRIQPPKSTGRELFGDRFFQDYPMPDDVSYEDLIRTAAMFTAESIIYSYNKWLPAVPDNVIVTGGGAHNPIIMESLKSGLPSSRVMTGDEAGIPTDFKEAAAFALMGLYYMLNLPSNVPAATGASGPAICGKLSKPLTVFNILERT